MPHSRRHLTVRSLIVLSLVLPGLAWAGAIQVTNGNGVGPAPPAIDVDPDELFSTLEQGQTETRELTIANLGDETLEWNVSEEVLELQRIGAITLESGENSAASAVIDPAGEFAYVGTDTFSGGLSRVVKIDLGTFERVGAITLESGEDRLLSAAIDPAGNFAYFGTYHESGASRVVKIDLERFERVGAITLQSGENRLLPAVIDPVGDFAYFGTATFPGRVVKIDLETFQRVGAITLESGENGLLSAVIDPAGDFAYFGTFTFFGRIVKIDLETFQRVGAIAMESGEDFLYSAVIDPVGEFAYFGTDTAPGRVVKVDLETFERDEAITLEVGEDSLWSAVIDTAGNFAYFGTNTSPGRVVQIDLQSFEREDAVELESGEELLFSEVIDPAGGFAYFGTLTSPGRVVKIGLGGHDCTLPDWIGVDPDSGSLPGGEDQTVDVTFDATGLQPGEFEANLCLSSNGPSRPVAVVPLALSVTGTGVAELTFDPPSLDFGQVDVGDTSPSQTATLENTGDIDLTGLAFGAAGGGFDADTSACGTALAFGESCDVSITFTPLEPGPVDATLEVTSDQGAGTNLNLTGSGLGEAAENDTILVSRASGVDGVKGNGASGPPLFPGDDRNVSADGRYVAFESLAGNLHPDDTDIVEDVFVRNTQTHETILVSRADGPDGSKGNSSSINPSISAAGRYVAFASLANNLHPDDTDPLPDILVRDTQTNETVLVSRADGAEGAKGNGPSLNPAISADGRYVAFASLATNLHPDDTDGILDVFVRDLQAHETILVSRAGGVDGVKGNGNSGLFAPSISADGLYVAFPTQASNLDPDDTDAILDVFVRGLQTHETILVSRAGGADGAKGDEFSGFPSISGDGRHVAFVSDATNLHPDDTNIRADVFVRDTQKSETILASRANGSDGANGNGGSTFPSISANGRYVAFASDATNFHPDDFDDVRDVFVRDLQAQETILASRSGAGGVKGNGISTIPSIAAAGRFVVFASAATNLHPDDMDDIQDVYLGDIFSGATIAVDPDRFTVALDAGDMAEETLTVGNLGEIDDLEWALTEESPEIHGLLRRSETTITHSASFDVVAGVGATCPASSGGNMFLRTFALEDFGIFHELDITEVTFGIEELVGSAPVTVNLYTLEGAFLYANLTLIGTATETFDDQEVTLVTVPVTGTAPRGSTLVVEIAVPGVPYFPGANTLGETAPSYIALDAAGLCGPLSEREPTPFADTNFPGRHLVIAVTGQTEPVDCALPDWLTANPASGSVAPGTTQPVTVTFDATGVPEGDHRAFLCLASNDPDTPLVVVPADLTVIGGGAELGFDPASLDFGEVEVGTESAPLSATLSNVGTAEATGLVFSVSGDGFEVDASDCGSSLPAEASCEVSITLTPLAPGPAGATLTVESVEGATIDLELNGNGVEPAPPAIEVDPDELFSTLAQGQMETQELTIANVGEETLEWEVTDAVLELQRIDAIALELGENLLRSAVIDPAGDFAYFGTNTVPGRVVKIDLKTFERIEAITLESGEEGLLTAVIAPAGDFAYFGTNTAPGRVVKIDLETFERVEAITLESGEDFLRSSVIDPAGGFAYFATATSPGPGRVVKIDLEAFERVEAAELEVGEDGLLSAVIAPAGDFAYFGTSTFPGRVVKIDLETFERVEAVELEVGEDGLLSAVIAPAGDFAYFGTFTFPGRVVKIDLETFERVEAVELEVGEDGLLSAVIAPAGDFAYFGTFTFPGQVVKIDLETFERVDAITLESGEDNLFSAVIAPAGDFAYFGTLTDPGRVVKIGLGGQDCALPDWVSVDPMSGSVLGGNDQVALVAFDASDLEPGDYEATLCLVSNDPAQPVTLAPLALTVTPSGAPELAFAPESLDFGEVEVGSTSLPQTATLQNIGSSDATGLTFGPTGSAFEADTGACGDTLPSGASCEVSVTFTPVEPGPTSATLEVTSDHDASAGLSLAGTGVSDGVVTPVELVVDPEALLSDGNEVLEPGELIEVAPAWRNDGLLDESFTGTASSFNGLDGANYLLPLDDADYGNVEPGATASCLDTGVCYWMGVNDPAVRPATHWQTTFDESLSEGTTKTWSLHIGASFTDVPRESPFYTSIETLLHHEVTGGCTASEYCPAGGNTRGQMAVFLLKAAEGGEYAPPACEVGQELFADVPFDSPLCPWIEELAARQVTSGCGGGNYCPGSPVTRAQMAVFLLKAFEGEGYTPPECSGEFSDVTCPSTFAAWIEELSARGITGGCAADPPAYCPTAPVTRQQMAVFVTRTFGLTLYGP